jgi:hypothetical protein
MKFKIRIDDFPIYCRNNIEIVNCKNCNREFPRWKIKHRPAKDRRIVMVKGKNIVNCCSACTREYSNPSAKNRRKNIVGEKSK